MDSSDINCDNINDLNFEIFNKIGQDYNIVNNIFYALRIYKILQIEEIPERAIGNLKFEWIEIGPCSKLKRIHYKAFESSWKTLNTLQIENYYMETDQASPYSVWELSNAFLNLETLLLYIPMKVIKDGDLGENLLRSLADIRINVSSIEGSPFYHSQNLESISFTQGNIKYIPASTFKMKNNSRFSYIDFDGNRYIDSSSFEVGTFDNLTSVTIGFRSFKLNYLDEKIFVPFLNSHPKNRITISGSRTDEGAYTDCNDCNSFWAFQRKELKERIEAYCDKENKKSFWDDDNFRECKKMTTTIKTTLPKTTITTTLPTATITNILLTTTITTTLPTTILMPSKCPDKQELKPCTCDSNYDDFDISCKEIENFDVIKNVFQRISRNKSVVNSLYDTFHLFDNQIEEIDEEALGNVTFKQITIECVKLERIHFRAFESSFKTATALHILNSKNFQAEQPSPYSLLDMVNSFEKLDVLHLEPEIEELDGHDLGRNLSRVSVVNLHVNSLKGSPFYLFNNLHNIFLHSNKLNYIPASTFKFVNITNKYNRMFIYLHSNQLNGSSFQVGTFENVKIPMQIGFDVETHNRISYLEEKVFWPFFQVNAQNKLDLKGIDLDCNDCRSRWLIEKQNTLKGRIYSPYCGKETSKNFWEKDSFKNCISTTTHLYDFN
jgi:hypothetical protein